MNPGCNSKSWCHPELSRRCGLCPKRKVPSPPKQRKQSKAKQSKKPTLPLPRNRRMATGWNRSAAQTTMALGLLLAAATCLACLAPAQALSEATSVQLPSKACSNLNLRVCFLHGPSPDMKNVDIVLISAESGKQFQVSIAAAVTGISVRERRGEEERTRETGGGRGAQIQTCTDTDTDMY